MKSRFLLKGHSIDEAVPLLQMRILANLPINIPANGGKLTIADVLGANTSRFSRVTARLVP